MTIEHEDYNPGQADLPKQPKRRNFLEEQFQLHATVGPDGGGADFFRKKRVTFEVPRAMCSVEFPEDFDLTLAELDGDIEAEASSKSRNGAELGLIMAKMSMHGVNGAPLPETRREWLWNALGMGGRTLVVSVFHEHLGMGAGEQGKARIEAVVARARVE